MADLAPSATCITISYNPDTNQKVYTVDGAWDPSSCYGQVMVIHTEFRDLLAASGTGSGAPVDSTGGGGFPPLSVADGVEISWLIGGAWSIAFAARLVIRSLWRTAQISSDP
ncbi:hypothetical protein [Aquabacterium sp. CECT 9606]|uniref:hypothetical protein n=1 Tax=Aquabacterium sp. CECT 9606 TaxID=2845822 RepID=UPI001E5BB20D|nr:hypothetical protein [Aquabacterium sp. CECT 9606]